MMNKEPSMIDSQPHAASEKVNPDINFAAALRAQYAIERTPRRRHKKPTAQDKIEEPLVDNTAILPLHSKKTDRMQKRQNKKSQKVGLSFTDLPPEILLEISSWLRVADVFRLSRTSRSMTNFVQNHGTNIANRILRVRYWVLHRCFPAPVAIDSVPEEYHESLLDVRRQELLNIHKKSYHQHIEMIDPKAVCTCLTCIFAWNNLCLLVDLHHWQDDLNRGDPIPMIQRGTPPQWNEMLLKENADVVRSAIKQPLMYAAILEKHLATITGTILRSSQWKKKTTSAKPRLYHMTDWDVVSGTDAFLERKGPPSYDFPFHRDVYYSLEAYLPNRRWDDHKWNYYPRAPAQHNRDLEWVKSAAQPSASGKPARSQALANLKDHDNSRSQHQTRSTSVSSSMSLMSGDSRSPINTG